MPIDHTPITDRENDSELRKGKEPKLSFYESEPCYDFADIILPDDVEHNVRRAISFIKNQKVLFDDWNLKSVIKRHNLCINLYGASGTGKTMTAHAIAKQLVRKLIVVNYAEIESKYVGETSKNLAKLFQYAQQSNGILLFDEADALLSKRVTAMRSATDVSVNQTRNTLLKILDEYEGIVVFTTNFIQNFDMAFLRRIFSNIEFKLPNRDARKKLWDHYLLSTMPIEDKEGLLENIAEVDDLSGADISTIVLKAAIDVVGEPGRRIDEDLLLHMIEEVKNARRAVQGKYEITTRKVSEEYALEKIKGGGNVNGTIK